MIFWCENAQRAGTEHVCMIKLKTRVDGEPEAFVNTRFTMFTTDFSIITAVLNPDFDVSQSCGTRIPAGYIITCKKKFDMQLSATRVNTGIQEEVIN